MSLLAQELLEKGKKVSKEAKMSETIMKHTNNYYPNQISSDIEMSSSLINSAQSTLTDLDRTISELALLVEGLKKQSEKLAI